MGYSFFNLGGGEQNYSVGLNRNVILLNILPRDFGLGDSKIGIVFAY